MTFNPQPKPQKRRKSRVKTSRVSSHLKAVKELPCVTCGRAGPSDAHHVYHDRYSGKKASDYATIPLCKDCHQNAPYSVHRDKNGWREQCGPDHSYIASTLKAIYGEKFSEDH